MKDNLAHIISKTPVVILAGGAGINLGINGSIIPKPMVDIEGAPLLRYILDHYGKSGFRKFVICGGRDLEMIREFVIHLDRVKWDITVVDTGINSMTGSRLAQVRLKVDDSPMFCLTYGDTLSDVNLHEILKFHLNHKKTGTLVAVHNPTRFRILGLCDDDDLIRGFSDKPVLEKDYINGGFYIFNKNIFNLESLSVDASCVLENEVLEELISKKELYAYKYNGFWQPLDNERDKQKIALFI